MSKIFVYLSGGLGNQMFQYAAARASAIRNEAELVLDSWSGFVRDFQYNRKFELDRLPIRGRLAGRLERMPIWIYRVEARLRLRRPEIINFRRYGVFLSEPESEFLPEVLGFIPQSSCWFAGYWQSPIYFHDYSTILREELTPSTPSDLRFQEMGELVKSTNSVALGVRLYEESVDPTLHADEGRVKTVQEINRAITDLETKVEGARFFVFCTHRASLLDQLALPKNTVYVTADSGFSDAVDNLWLLSQCKHHIFTNSSFYWWGAFLSRRHSEGCIYAADNFINRDCLCEQWYRF